MATLIQRLIADESGGNLIQYGLLSVMMGTMLLLAFQAYAASADNLWTYVSETVTSVN